MKSQELVNQLEDCQRELAQVAWQLTRIYGPRTVSSLGELYRDLVALEQEPFELQIDLDEHELSVTTEPIVLEGIALGRFEIVLDWQELAATIPAIVSWRSIPIQRPPTKQSRIPM